MYFNHIKPGSSIYYALRKDKDKASLATLYNFFTELQHSILTCTELSVAHQKLSWWHQELECIFANNMQKPQHPISIELTTVVNTYAIPKIYYSQTLAALSGFITTRSFHSQQEQYDYLNKTVGNLMRCLAYVFKINSQKIMDDLVTLGIHLAQINLLQNLNAHLQRDYLYIPYQTLKQLQINPQELINQNIDSNKLNTIFKLEINTITTKIQAINYSATMPQCIIILIKLYLALAHELKTTTSLNTKICLTPIRKLLLSYF